MAGTNGAGKSSIAGAIFLAKGTDYFNPMKPRLESVTPGRTSPKPKQIVRLGIRVPEWAKPIVAAALKIDGQRAP